MLQRSTDVINQTSYGLFNTEPMVMFNSADANSTEYFLQLSYSVHFWMAVINN